jgi:hypothetical protein
LSSRPAEYPLFEALLRRRSRRVGLGAALDRGPLAFTSASPPDPLTADETAALVFAAAGVTGPVIADLPIGRPEPADTGSGFGEVMMQLVGRTVPSGDANHGVALIVSDAGGTWYVRRPQDIATAEIAGLVDAARAGRFAEVYAAMRVRIAPGRVRIARRDEMPFNRSSEGEPGTTTFLPVAETTALSLNALLTAFEPELGFFLLDERAGYRPAGLRRFARSRGGHLDDDPARGRVATMAQAEAWICEFLAIEQGAMLQNLALAAEALGLGGFPHFAAHSVAWFEALGFRIQALPVSTLIGAGPALRLALRLSGRDHAIPVPLGLERDGVPLLVPYAPPYHATMEAAVLAFVEDKYGRHLADPGRSAWRAPQAVLGALSRPSDAAIAATIAYCEYVHRRYGRFPAAGGPFRTVLAYQAHRPDPAFLDRFYAPGAGGMAPPPETGP